MSNSTRRTCLDCPTDISKRHQHAKRCHRCAPIAANRLSNQAKEDRLRGAGGGPIVARGPAAPIARVGQIDMTPARVVTVDGEQFEVAWSGGAGLSSVGGVL